MNLIYAPSCTWYKKHNTFQERSSQQFDDVISHISIIQYCFKVTICTFSLVLILEMIMAIRSHLNTRYTQ